MKTFRSIAFVVAAALVASCGGADAPESSEGRNVARVVTQRGMPQLGTSSAYLTSLSYSEELDKFVATESGEYIDHGLQTGYAAMFSTAKPESDVLAATFPRTDGPIYSVTPAGVGGFYVAGEFTVIGGVRRSYLAKVNIDGSIDERFDARIVPKDAVAGWSPAVLDVALVDSGRVLAINAREMRSYGGTAQAESLVFLDPATGAHRPINGQGRYLGPFPRLHGSSRGNANASMSWVGNDLFEKPFGWGQGVPPAHRTTWQFGNSISRVNDELWTQAVATKLPSFVGATREQSQFTTAIEVAGDDVIILGNLDRQGRRLAAFSRTTGQIRNWNPVLPVPIPAASLDSTDIAVTATNVFLATPNGAGGGRGYRIDRTTGQVSEWILGPEIDSIFMQAGAVGLFEFGDGVIVASGSHPRTFLFAPDGSRSRTTLPLNGFIGDVVDRPSCRCAVLLSRQPTNIVSPVSPSMSATLDSIGNAVFPPPFRSDGRILEAVGSAGRWIYAVSTNSEVNLNEWRLPQADIVAGQRVVRFDAESGVLDPAWSMTPVELALDEAQVMIGASKIFHWSTDPDTDQGFAFVTDLAAGGPARRLPGFSAEGLDCTFYGTYNTAPIAGDRVWAEVECQPAGGAGAGSVYLLASLDLVSEQWSLHQHPTAVWNWATDQETALLASNTHLYFHDSRTGRKRGEFRITPGLEWTARSSLVVTLADRVVLFDYSNGESRAFSSSDFSDLGPWRNKLGSWLTNVVKGSETVLAAIPTGSVLDLGNNVEATGFVAFDFTGKALTTKPAPPAGGGEDTAVYIQPVPGGSLPAGTPVQGSPEASGGVSTGPISGPRAGSADKPSILSTRAGNKSVTVRFASPATGTEHVVEVAGTKLSCRTEGTSCTVKGLKSHVFYVFTVRTVDGSTPPSDRSAPVRPYVSMKRNAKAKATSILAPAGKGTLTWKASGACSFLKATSLIVTTSKRGRCAVSVTSKAAGKKAVTRKAVVVVS